MKKLTEVKLLLWDFDGVLMDSMPIRNQGFQLVLRSYPPEEVQQLMAYHKANGGLSRYVKLRYFFEHIRGEQVALDTIMNLASQFSEIMLKKLIDKSLLIADSINFVMANYQRIPMHIVSGSDGVELNTICQNINIAAYFKSIHGSPTPKNELIHLLLKSYPHINPSEVVLIGDSRNDFEAAVDNNIIFWGYNNTSLSNLGDGYIHSFSTLDAYREN